MDQPTSQQIRAFLDVFKKVCDFEAHMLHVRGYGAGIEGPRPVPEVVTTIRWLEYLASETA